MRAVASGAAHGAALSVAHGAVASSTLHGAAALAFEHSALAEETAALAAETAELRALSAACGAAFSHPPPEHYQIGLAIATCGLLVTMGLHRHAVRALRARTAFSSKRVLYRLITGLAPAIAWVHFLAVTSPPMHRVAALTHHCLVAFVMACFMELLLLLLFRTARAGEGGVDESAVPAIPNVLQETTYTAHAIHMLCTWHVHMPCLDYAHAPQRAAALRELIFAHGLRALRAIELH